MEPSPLRDEKCILCDKPLLDGSPYEYAKPRRGKKVSFFHRICFDVLLKKGDHNGKQ